ncbi:O-methyltransferase [Flammeovirga agarivorans]|uniref:Class I SAM-dependent methyltransferase n=1 Tax=Flammeovirga agarivorans TaxID=2726742 RepID=A0A7X8SLZ2_9BACT|nr:class I SAM-dependent methyltransferase [Flammeovirga agarivorans]NLR92679.1 class I SAM-dependent methyltransferase [Flammeovirga agarivorans]
MQVFDFLKYKYNAGNAHGLHSPFVYELYTQVIEPQKYYYFFDQIEKERQQLLANDQEIKVTDLGAGSRKHNTINRKVNSIAESSLSNKRTGSFLFELVHRYKYENILELGTSLGISSMYLAAASKKVKLTTIEGCPNIANIAQDIFNKHKHLNIDSKVGNINNLLPEVLKEKKQIDLVYFDANHTYDATMNYYNLCKNYAHENTLFIFDDIYWSKGMKKAWNEISQDKEIGISIDLYHLGLVYFRKKQPKQHFTLIY